MLIFSYIFKSSILFNIKKSYLFDKKNLLYFKYILKIIIKKMFHFLSIITRFNLYQNYKDNNIYQI